MGFKGRLQPTELGLAVDKFLEQVLPELVQSEFTAEMEMSLDAIAIGEKNWQEYLTNWNRSYFAPAVTKAYELIGKTPKSFTSSQAKSKLTNYSCPICNQPLEEYLYSKNGQKKSLLRCSDMQARKRKDHQEVVFFKSKSAWWNKKFGELK
jgi:DNA topoisomerase-1